MLALATHDLVLLTLVAIMLGVISLLATLIIGFRHRRLLRKYRALLNGPVGSDLEQLLLEQREALNALDSKVQALDNTVEALQQSTRYHVQHIGVLRFNAFPDTGSDLSFAVAMLDANGNGTVISSLFGRNDQRVYAKPIEGGKSTYILTAEEQHAIDKALKRS